MDVARGAGYIVVVNEQSTVPTYVGCCKTAAAAAAAAAAPPPPPPSGGPVRDSARGLEPGALWVSKRRRQCSRRERTNERTYRAHKLGVGWLVVVVVHAVVLHSLQGTKAQSPPTTRAKGTHPPRMQFSHQQHDMPSNACYVRMYASDPLEPLPQRPRIVRHIATRMADWCTTHIGAPYTMAHSIGIGHTLASTEASVLLAWAASLS
jgi:hypothetical protein